MSIEKPAILLKNNFILKPDKLYNDLSSSIQWDERMKARKTASYGLPYNYSGIVYPQTAMHPALTPICTNLETTLGFYPNNCLLNYYQDGNATMGYHSDASESLEPGTGVAIVSLGAKRIISYRSKIDKHIMHNYLLTKGSLLYMSNEIQTNWMHAIPKQANSAERISLTFRLIIKQ